MTRTTRNIAIFVLSAGVILAWPPVDAGAQEVPSRDATSASRTLAADSPTLVSDSLLWAAVGLSRILEARDYPGLLVLSTLASPAAGAAGPVQGEAEALLSLLERARSVASVERCRERDDPVEGALCALELLTPIAPPELRPRLAEEGARLVRSVLRSDSAAVATILPMALSRAGRYTELSTPAATGALQRYAERVLEDAWRAATARAAGAIGAAGAAGAAGTIEPASGLLERVVGAAPGAARSELLARSPQLRAILERHPVLSATAADAQQLQTVLNEYHGFLGGLADGVSQALAGRGGQAGTAAFASAGTPAEWAAERAFVYLVARSAAAAGAGDPVAERIRTIGSAAADLRRGVSVFSANLPALGQQAATLALGGNVFAVAAGVASFFGANPAALGPGAAGEVRVLRQAVDTLRTEMNARFDDLDVGLDSMFGVLDTRFGRLESLVATSNRDVRGELVTLHAEIAALGQRIDRAESNIQMSLQTGFDRPYQLTRTRCLEHRQRHLPPLDRIEFGVFSGCLVEFRARAVQEARDPLLTDRTTPTDDASLIVALADSSLAGLAPRLPLLARVARQRFAYDALGDAALLANPSEWLAAADAYVRMLHDWPEHARSVAPADAAAIHDVGVQVRDALRAMTVDPATGERGVLLHRVLDAYRARGTALVGEIDALAGRHLDDLRRLPSEPLVPSLRPAEAGRTVLQAPDFVQQAVPREVRTAAALGLGDAELVYRVTVEDSVVRQNFRRPFPWFSRRHDRLTWSRPSVDVELRFADRGAVAAWQATGEPFLRVVEEMGGAADSEQVRSTRVLIDDPWSHVVESQWSSLTASPGAWQSRPPSSAALATLEQASDDALARRASANVDAVFAAACGEREVAGAPTDAESARRIREGLDGLSAARALLGAYVRLGLPWSAVADERLREMLYGARALPDRAALCAAVRQGESPLRLLWLDDEPRRQADELARLIDEVLAEPGAVPQTFTGIEDTLRELDAAVRIQRVREALARQGG